MNKVALVTGASGGLGSSISLRLAADGAEVILAARSVEKLESLADQIRAAGGKARTLVLDLAKPETFANAIDRLDSIDVLINNAAADDKPSPLIQGDIQGWRDAFEINFFAPLQLTALVAQKMVAQGRGGAIVNISSIAGSLAPTPFLGAYSCSKSALDMLTRVVGSELAGAGIRVNAVAPGMINAGKIRENLPQEFIDVLPKLIPAGRLGDAADIAGAVAWLVSEDSAYVNGAIITVDGAFGFGTWQMAGASGFTG